MRVYVPGFNPITSTLTPSLVSLTRYSKSSPARDPLTGPEYDTAVTSASFTPLIVAYIISFQPPTVVKLVADAA